LLYLTLTLALIPVQIVNVALGLSAADRLPRYYHGLCARLIGLRIKVLGRPASARPTLFVANHVSYLDIVALGSLIEGSFVAKREVARWPLFGLLAKLQRTVFVDRRRQRTAEGRNDIAERLARGGHLILFPEGTSSDGSRALPFKSAMFAAVEAAGDAVAEGLTVQPVSIAYTRLDGMPLGRGLKPYFAWYGDMELAPHLWDMLGLGRVTVEIRFHDELNRSDFRDRKSLAKRCHRAVAEGLAASLSGRSRP
jgi:1-acyl-sn-glycerol-3-phosphate acyltransferase